MSNLRSSAATILLVAAVFTGWCAMVAAQQPARNADPDEGFAPPRPTPTGAAPKDPDEGYAPPRIPPKGQAPAAGGTAAPAGLELPKPDGGGTAQPAQDATQQEREWLVAYLIAHQGYRIDQMDELEKRMDRMSPTQVRTLVDLYQQKHQFALHRELANQQARNQAFSMQTADYNQRVQQEQMTRQELDAGATAEQSRLNQQQSQARQNVEQNSLMHQSNYMNQGNYVNPYGGGAFYDRYWH